MNISFSKTTQQIRAKTKTVTRRLAWQRLVKLIAQGQRPLLQPVVKGQGLRKGEHIRKIGGQIRVVSARRERLNTLIDGTYSLAAAHKEIRREGFDLSPLEFVDFFCQVNDCKPQQMVTRIEFEYL